MDMESFYTITLGHVDWDTILKTRQIHKSTHITLVFGRLQRVQHLGIIVNAEGSNHLSFAFLIVFLVHHLQRHHTCQISLIRKIAEAPPCPGAQAILTSLEFLVLALAASRGMASTLMLNFLALVFSQSYL